VREAAGAVRLIPSGSYGVGVAATNAVQYARTLLFFPAAAITVARSAPLRTDGQPVPAATTELHRSSRLGDELMVGVPAAGAEPAAAVGVAFAPEPVAPAGAAPDTAPVNAVAAGGGAVGSRPVAAP